MKVTPARVILGWILFEVVLSEIMWFFHEKWYYIMMYGLWALPLLIGGLLLLRGDRRPQLPPQQYTMGQRSGLVFPLAVGIGMTGIGFIYGRQWIAVGSILAVISLIYLIDRPVTPGAGDDDEVVTQPVAAMPQPRPQEREQPAGLTRLAVAAITAFRSLRAPRGRRR